MNAEFGPNAFTVSRQSAFTRERFGDLQLRAAEWLIKGLLPAQGVGFMYGASRSRKSFLAVDLSAHVAAGATSYFVRKSVGGGVIYIASEDSEGIKKRFITIRMKRDFPPNIPLEIIPQAPNLLDDGSWADLEATLLEASDEMSAAGHRLRLIVIDTAAASMAGADENSSTSMGALMQRLHGLARELRCLILVVAHTGKDEGRGIRGWSGQFAGADVVITVERDKEEDGRSLVTFEKVKGANDSNLRFAFTMESVVLAYDEDGDEIGCAVPVFEDAPERKAKGVRRTELNAHERIVLTAIGYAIDHGPTMSVAHIHGAKTHQMAVTRSTAKARAVATGLAEADEKPNTVTARFSRALSELVKREKVRVDGDLVWLL